MAYEGKVKVGGNYGQVHQSTHNEKALLKAICEDTVVESISTFRRPRLRLPVGASGHLVSLFFQVSLSLRLYDVSACLSGLVRQC